MIRRILLTLPLTLLALAAADKPDFSGTWKLNHSKSDVGAPAQSTKKVEQSDKEMKMTTIQAGQTTETTLRLDGKPNDHGVSAKWEGTTLVVRSKRDVGGVKLQSEERWTRDGSALTVATRITGGPNGDLTMKYVYDKE